MSVRSHRVPLSHLSHVGPPRWENVVSRPRDRQWSKFRRRIRACGLDSGDAPTGPGSGVEVVAETPATPARPGHEPCMIVPLARVLKRRAARVGPEISHLELAERCLTMVVLSPVQADLLTYSSKVMDVGPGSDDVPVSLVGADGHRRSGSAAAAAPFAASRLHTPTFAEEERWVHGCCAVFAVLLLGSIALVLATGLWAPPPPAAAVPPQEPGVTLRVFDMQTPLSGICTLKAGQTPNVDKRMSVVNWTSSADFGLEDNFLAQVLGNVNITTAGSYTFRLTSDEGSRLLIDSKTVINHDGLHGPTPEGRHRHPDRRLSRAAHRTFRTRRRSAAHPRMARPRIVLVRPRARTRVEHRRRRRPGDRAGQEAVRDRRGLAAATAGRSSMCTPASR